MAFPLLVPLAIFGLWAVRKGVDYKLDSRKKTIKSNKKRGKQ